MNKTLSMTIRDWLSEVGLIVKMPMYPRFDNNLRSERSLRCTSAAQAQDSLQVLVLRSTLLYCGVGSSLTGRAFPPVQHSCVATGANHIARSLRCTRWTTREGSNKNIRKPPLRHFVLSSLEGRESFLAIQYFNEK